MHNEMPFAVHFVVSVADIPLHLTMHDEMLLAQHFIDVLLHIAVH